VCLYTDVWSRRERERERDLTEQSFYDVTRGDIMSSTPVWRKIIISSVCGGGFSNMMWMRRISLPNNFFISCHVAVFSLCAFCAAARESVRAQFFPGSARRFYPRDIYHFQLELFGTCIIARGKRRRDPSERAAFLPHQRCNANCTRRG